MPSMPDSVPPLQSIIALIDEACEFTQSRDEWIEEHGAQRGHSGEQRLGLLNARRQLQLLARASRLQRSVGFYGESQCGKSNLVSRIGGGLGASVTASGSLLVKDPSPVGASSPWGVEGHPGCIEFAKWLNPIVNTEATGVICRLTTADAGSDVHPGCFRARVMSQADLVISIAIGNGDDTEYAGSKRVLQQELARIRDLPTEQDHGRFVDELLVAWNFLVARWGGEGEPNARARDLIESGWREYLRELFLRGVRPVWDPRSKECAYLRMVGLLWSGQSDLTDVFWRLLQASELTGGASELCVEAAEVCRSDEPAHHSLLDVRNIDSLFDERIGGRGVHVRFRQANGGWGVAGIPRSMLSALIRELELPLATDGPRGGASVDVLDFPGARSTSAAGQIERDQNPLQRALSVFRRGKLNYLFLAGVDLYDCSALCLVVTGNGPLNAGAVVRQAVGHWLRREDPGYALRHRDRGRLGGAERAAALVDPPLVVAVSKADMLVNEAAGAQSLFGGRLGELEKEYCCDPRWPWLGQWSTGGPFRRVHWVHNPDAPGAQSLREFLQPGRSAALDRIRRTYLSDGMVLRHVAEPGPAFERLFRSPEDVDALFGTVSEVVRTVRREQRILEDAVAALEPEVSAVNRDYLGASDGGRAAAERREALADVDALEAVLAKGRNPVSMLLRGLQVSPIDVQRACRAAMADVGRDDPGEVGVLRFSDFYAQLSKGFVDRLDRRLPDGSSLAQLLRGSSGTDGSRQVLLSLRQHFAAMPGASWFRSSVESQVGSMFGAMDAAALTSSPVLAAVASTAWNRCVVWLDRQPEALQSTPPGLPRRRTAHASSARILSHWRDRLPDVYERMVDPLGASAPGNAALGTMRESLRSAVEATLAALRGAGVADVQGLQARLAKLESVLRP